MTRPTPTPFSARLAHLMSRAGLSDAELAARSGVSRMQVWRLRMGRAAPTLETAARLADVLNVTLDELWGVIQPPPRTNNK